MYRASMSNVMTNKNKKMIQSFDNLNHVWQLNPKVVDLNDNRTTPWLNTLKPLTFLYSNKSINQSPDMEDQ